MRFVVLIMASRLSVNDLVSASSEKLEPLPTLSRERLNFNEKAEKEWLEEMTEKADRGELAREAAARFLLVYGIIRWHFSAQMMLNLVCCLHWDSTTFPHRTIQRR